MSQYTETVRLLEGRIMSGEPVTERDIFGLRALTNMPDVEAAIARLVRMLRDRPNAT